MNKEFSKPFNNIQKHVPKNQKCLFNIILQDASTAFITIDKAGGFILYNLKNNKVIKMKQSQDCIKLQQEAEKKMKKGLN